MGVFSNHGPLVVFSNVLLCSYIKKRKNEIKVRVEIKVEFKVGIITERDA